MAMYRCGRSSGCGNVGYVWHILYLSSMEMLLGGYIPMWAFQWVWLYIDVGVWYLLSTDVPDQCIW